MIISNMDTLNGPKSIGIRKIDTTPSSNCWIYVIIKITVLTVAIQQLVIILVG